MSSAPAVLDRLQGVKRSGSGWIARCPAHADKNPSLSIHERDGKLLLKCFAGCSSEAVCAALGIELAELFSDNSAGQQRIVAAYGYEDETGKLLFQVVRLEPKTFRQRRPDGAGGWHWNLHGVRRVLYRLPEVLAEKSLLICEGEKDCETARALGIVATCNPGGAGKWREEYSERLRGKQITIIADADEPGRKHAQQVAESLHLRAESVKVLELPGTKDLSEWTAIGGTRDALLELVRDAPAWKPATATRTSSPWEHAVGMDVFLAGEDEPVAFLMDHVIAKGAITEIFSPRGLGKSLWATCAAVQLAARGYNVLLIDRDNPRRAVRERLRAFGATPDLTRLKFLSRENAPPLTNATAWAEFPCADYDVVILDSLDSAAEGVGEQDSAKPSRAIAPLLDIADARTAQRFSCWATPSSRPRTRGAAGLSKIAPTSFLKFVTVRTSTLAGRSPGLRNFPQLALITGCRGHPGANAARNIDWPSSQRNSASVKSRTCPYRQLRSCSSTMSQLPSALKMN